MYYLKAQKINTIIYTFFSVILILLWLFPNDEISSLTILHLLCVINLIVNIVLYFVNKGYVNKDLKIPKFLRVITIIILVLSIIPLLVRIDVMFELYMDLFKKK